MPVTRLTGGQFFSPIEKDLNQSLQAANRHDLALLHANFKWDVFVNAKQNRMIGMWVDTLTDSSGIASMSEDLIHNNGEIARDPSRVFETGLQSHNQLTAAIAYHGSNEDNHGWVFTADKDYLASSAGIYFACNAASSWTFRLSFLDCGADPSAATSPPSGILKATVLSSSYAYNAPIGWKDVQFPAPLQLEAGRVYAITFSVSSSAALTANGPTAPLDVGQFWLKQISYDWQKTNGLPIRLTVYRDDHGMVTSVIQNTEITPRKAIVLSEVSYQTPADSIELEITRDSGQTWKPILPGVQTSLDDLPEGQAIALRAHIHGQASMSAWGVAWS